MFAAENVTQPTELGAQNLYTESGRVAASTGGFVGDAANVRVGDLREASEKRRLRAIERIT